MVITSQFTDPMCQSVASEVQFNAFNNCTAFPGVDNLFWIPREVLEEQPPLNEQPPEFPEVDNLLPVITTQVWFELDCPGTTPNLFFHRTSICSQNLDPDGGLIFATLDCPEPGGTVLQTEFTDNQCTSGAIELNFLPTCIPELNSGASVMVTCQANINAPPDDSSDSSLSTGAIAGIAVAGFCICCLIAGLAIFSLFGVKKIRSQSKKLAEQEQKIELSEEERQTIKVIKVSDLTFTKEVGKGAFGQVWMGKWNDKVVAIKKQLSTAPITVQETLSEFTIQFNIPKHENVVQLLGFCTHPVAIVLEFCGGGSLRGLLDSNSEIKPQHVQNWMKGIADGMKHIHSHNITHRDLAARNILLSDNLAPKISDFGLSRELAAEEGVTVSVVGPLKWMAPECLLEQKYGEKTDVFAYGITCLEILTRKLPYPGIRNQEFAIKWSSLIKTLPEQLPPETELPLRELLLWTWKELPEDRPTFGRIIEYINENSSEGGIHSVALSPSTATPSLVRLEASNYNHTPSEISGEKSETYTEGKTYTAPEEKEDHVYAQSPSTVLTPRSEPSETTDYSNPQDSKEPEHAYSHAAVRVPEEHAYAHTTSSSITEGHQESKQPKEPKEKEKEEEEEEEHAYFYTEGTPSKDQE